MTFVSAVIPTRDRPALLADCLASLAAQRLTTGLLEVIVVDDGSEPDVSSVVEPWAQSAESVQIRYLRQQPSGLNVGRNAGAAAAAGDVIAFLDDDTLVDQGWAEAVARAFQEWRCDGLAGRISLQFEGPVPPWFRPEFRAHLSELDLGSEDRWLRPAESPWGANCAVSRAAFERVGGFAGGLDRKGHSLISNGDTEFFARVRSSGGRLAYVPSAAVRHRVPAERLTEQWFRRRAYGQGISDALLDPPAGGLLRVAKVGRELIRAGRAGPILAKGVRRGTGLVSARIWLAYCRGRLDGLGMSR